MDTIVILKVLQIALSAMGAIPALMALNEILNGENHATNGANKKLIGGIVFGAVAFLVMQGVITEMEKANSMTGQLDNSNISVAQVYDDINEEITIDEDKIHIKKVA